MRSADSAGSTVVGRPSQISTSRTAQLRMRPMQREQALDARRGAGQVRQPQSSQVPGNVDLGGHPIHHAVAIKDRGTRPCEPCMR